jgi:hypothetical protein
MLNSDKSATLNDFCDIFNLLQLVNGPTCFKKGCIPSLVDAIMTKKKSLCFKSQNVPTGVSDCHNIISTAIKGEVLHDGIQPFLKQVGPLTSCNRLKISQKSFKVALLSELSMSKFRSPNNNICS